MSPGDRSYDAIGLMKQLSEHTAETFADAKEVLRIGASEVMSKERCSSNNNHDPDHQLENHSHLASEVLVWFGKIFWGAFPFFFIFINTHIFLALIELKNIVIELLNPTDPFSSNTCHTTIFLCLSHLRWSNRLKIGFFFFPLD